MSARVEPVDPATTDPVAAAAFEALRQRGGQPLHLHRTLAQAPGLLGPFLNLAFALRATTPSSPADRELVILRTLHVRGGDYGYRHHLAMGAAAGLSEGQLADIPDWRTSARFNPRERALLAYTDAMVAPEGVDDATFDAVAAFLTPAEIVEVTLNASFYAAVSQFTTALRVEADPDDPGTRYGR
jgi:alkylhydroperoxidase family enzyme